MNSDWPILTLGDVCEKITDGAHNSPKSVKDGKPMASVKDLTRFGVDLTKARLIPTEDFDKLVKQGCQPEVGDVLIAKDGNSALDTVCIVDEPLDAVMLSSVAILRPNREKLDSDFLKYYFCSKEIIDYLKTNFISGAAIPRVVLKDFKKAEIKVPPIEKQREISKTLRCLDNKIELNRQTNQTLEQIAQAIFRSWFVDFDPVKAKIAAKQNEQDPELAAMCVISGKTEEQLKDLDEAALQQLKTTAALFPDVLLESELGEIPEGWDIKPLSEIAENHSTTFDFSKVDEVVFVNTGDVLEGRFLHKNYSSTVGLPGQAKKTIKKDDILYSEIRPKNKRFAYVVEDCDDYVVSTKFMIVRSLGFVHPRYLYQILRQEKTIQEFNLTAESRSGTFPQITFDSIGHMPVVVPTNSIQESFMEFFTPIIEKIDLAVMEENGLGKLRDTLLPKLLSGEIVLNETLLQKSESGAERRAI